MRESAEEGVDIIKLFLSGLDNILPEDDWETVLSEEAVAAAAETALSLGLSLSCHVRPVDGLKRALRHGFRTLYHAEEVDDEALAMMTARKNEIFVGPTIGGIAMRADRATGEIQERSIERLTAYHETVDRIRSAGVRVVPFGDYGFPGRPHGHNAQDLDYFVRYLGFSPSDVLVAATKSGGELMGGDPLGLVAPRYLADMLLIDGDPLADVRVLEDPRRIRMVMQNGTVQPRTPHPEPAPASP